MKSAKKAPLSQSKQKYFIFQEKITEKRYFFKKFKNRGN